jgi:hypothetical protein
MDSTLDDGVTVEKCNRNQCVTNSNTYNIKNNMNIDMGYALMRNTQQDEIFDVGTDVLDIAMRTFTMLAEIQMKNTHGDFLSIPIALWETDCRAHGLTPKQFLQAKAYCTALNLYEEQEGEVVLEARYVERKNMEE